MFVWSYRSKFINLKKGSIRFVRNRHWCGGRFKILIDKVEPFNIDGIFKNIH